MAALKGGAGDPWVITPDQRVKHDTQFVQLKPMNNFITGEQARGFLMQSGLPPVILGQIWSLADLNADGKMDKKEFSIAMHLIQKKLQGYELPKVLPPSMMADPVAAAPAGFGLPLGGLGLTSPPQSVPTAIPPPAATLGRTGGVGGSPYMLPPPGAATLPRPSQYGGTGAGGMAAPAAATGSAASPAQQAAAMNAEWGVPQSQKLKYTQMFNMHDRTKKGFLTGMEARAVLTQSNLTHTVLAQIWSLADVDNDGKLTCEEFILALYLVDLAKSGQAIPAKLPADLVPPSQRRSRSGSVQQTTSPPPGSAGVPVVASTQAATLQSVGGMGGWNTLKSSSTAWPEPAPWEGDGQFHTPQQPMNQPGMQFPPSAAVAPGATDSFGDLLSGFGGPVAGDVSSVFSNVTFEDKRKENFDKGQAELEKRREMLREQQKKEEEDRLAAEKAEFDKRERIRLEQEQKKQMELERQMARQRQLEEEREEHRRKALEQREAARRELERQRQLEWERQRREQLMAEKQREQSQVDQLNADVAKLKMELETLDNRKSELNIKIAQSRTGVTEFTAAIDEMRGDRDVKVADITKFQNEIEIWTQKYCTVQAERHQLDSQLQLHNNSVSDTYKSVMHSYSNKQVNIERLKSQMVQLEKDTTAKSAEIETSTNKLNDLNNQINELQALVSTVQDQLNEKKSQWQGIKSSRESEDVARRSADLEKQRQDLEAQRIREEGESQQNGGLFGWFDNKPAKSTKSKAAPTAPSASTDAWATAFDTSSSKSDTTTTNGGFDAWGSSATTTTTTKSSSYDPFAGLGDWGSTINWGSSPSAPSATIASSTSTTISTTTALFQSSSSPAFSAASPALTPQTVTSKTDAKNTAATKASSNLALTNQMHRTTLSEKELTHLWTATTQDGTTITAITTSASTETSSSSPDAFGAFDSFSFSEPFANSSQSNQAFPGTSDPFANNDSSSQQDSAFADAFGTTIDESAEKNSPEVFGNSDDAFGKNDDAFGKMNGDAFGKSSDDAFGKGADDAFGKAGDDAFGKAGDDAFGNEADDAFGKASDDAFGKNATGAFGTHDAFGDADVFSGSKENGEVEAAFGDPFAGGDPFASSTAEAGKQASFEDAFGSNDPFAEGSQSATSSDWASSFTTSATTNQTTGTTPATVTEASPGPGYKKHRALYQFDASREDELSFMPGDIIWLKPDQSDAEEGWSGGVLNGKEGWFPSAYVEPCTEDNDASAFSNSYTPTSNDTVQNQVAGTPPGGLQASDQSSFVAVPGSMPSPTPGQAEAVGEGVLAQAVYPWRAKKDNHLTFNRGDVIKVTQQQDIWWAGEFGGKEGWFPKSYVKLLGGATVTSTNGTNEIVAGSGENTANQTPTASTDSPVIAGAEMYVALYAYTSAEPGDLTFNQGEVIQVIKKDGDWWTGVIGDRTGIFPENYVKLMEIQPAAAVMETPTITTTDSPATSPPTDTHELPSKLSVPTQKLSAKKPEIASVIAPYQATGQEQLSLNPGQLIQVRKKSASGWWEGELQARGQKKKIGWFPANYVKMLGGGGSARSTPDGVRGSLSSPFKSSSPASSDTGSRTGTPQPSYPQPTYAPAVEQVVAVYNYTAQNDDELSFAKGSVINVVSKEDADWWKGEQNGVVGLFPSNYVSPLSDAVLEATQAESQAWNNEWVSGDNGYYSAATISSTMERSRQNAIDELITTEETYMTDLSIALEAFHKPMKEACILSELDLNKIFVNWNELIMCNTKFNKALRVRRKMSGVGQPIHMIGDILCENLPHLTPYVRYCSCQLNAANLIQRKTEEDGKFKEIQKKCQQLPKTKGMPLSSFLLKPMQRITKYPLIIEKILKYTPPDHPDHQNLEEALTKANELCNQVNEGVREKENSDRLEWIQTHVLCEGLPEKITFNSVTNCLGPRKVLHSGTLYKAKSGKELVAFLFNDFLLLTQPQRPMGSVASVFNFDTKAILQFKMYRMPIFLNEIMLQKPAELDGDTLFHLNHIDRVYSLKAHSTNEREVWTKKIEAASKQYLDTERKRRERAHSSRLRSSHDAFGRLMIIVMEGIDLIPSDDNVRQVKQPVGRLLVVIQEGVYLAQGEDGKSDPYCEVSMGLQEHRTKVIPNTLNPRWNASMQFTIKDLHEDVLCITVYDRDLFTPNDFLGRTEIRIKDIMSETSSSRGPITKRLQLHEVDSGEVIVKLDLQLYENSTGP